MSLVDYFYPVVLSRSLTRTTMALMAFVSADRELLGSMVVGLVVARVRVPLGMASFDSTDLVLFDWIYLVFY